VSVVRKGFTMAEDERKILTDIQMNIKTIMRNAGSA